MCHPCILAPSLHLSASVFPSLHSAPPFLALSFCSPTHKGWTGRNHKSPKELMATEPVIRGPLTTKTSQKTLVVPWTSVFGGSIGYKLHVQLILWLTCIWKLLPSLPMVWTFLLGANIHTTRIQDAGPVLADTLRKFLFDLNVDDGLAALGYSKDDIPSLVKGTLPQVRFTAWPSCLLNRASPLVTLQHPS